MWQNDIGTLISQIKYSQRKRTLIACGVISCVALCAVGFRTIPENNEDSRSAFNKENLIIPIDMQDPSSYAEVHPESFESYQIRILRNQNNIQADNIKALRDEL